MGGPSLSEVIKVEMSQYGIEVASEGSSSIQLKTPGIVNDIGAIIERIEEIAPTAVIDISSENGSLEILIAWSDQAQTADVSQHSNKHIVAGVAMAAAFLAFSASPYLATQPFNATL